MGRYCSRNLSWKCSSLGQEEGYSQLTRSRLGAEGTGSTRKPSGGSGLTGDRRKRGVSFGQVLGLSGGGGVRTSSASGVRATWERNVTSPASSNWPLT